MFHVLSVDFHPFCLLSLYFCRHVVPRRNVFRIPWSRGMRWYRHAGGGAVGACNRITIAYITKQLYYIIHERDITSLPCLHTYPPRAALLSRNIRHWQKQGWVDIPSHQHRIMAPAASLLHSSHPRRPDPSLVSWRGRSFSPAEFACGLVAFHVVSFSEPRSGCIILCSLYSPPVEYETSTQVTATAGGYFIQHRHTDCNWHYTNTT